MFLDTTVTVFLESMVDHMTVLDTILLRVLNATRVKITPQLLYFTVLRDLILFLLMQLHTAELTIITEFLIDFFLCVENKWLLLVDR
jgi:hypothetical protein